MAAVESQPALTLFRGFTPTPNYIWSPFVTKLEARLRFAGLAYKKDIGSPFTGPRGKLPYVIITNPNSSGPPTTMGDSTLITRKLVEDGVTEDLNAKLSPVEKAHDVALRGLLEDRLYWFQVSCLVSSRSVNLKLVNGESFAGVRTLA